MQIQRCTRSCVWQGRPHQASMSECPEDIVEEQVSTTARAHGKLCRKLSIHDRCLVWGTRVVIQSQRRPTRRWSKLHMDYAGPFQGNMFLVVIDALSKWIETFPVQSATSNITIDKLRRLFAQFGLPEVIVSDNGSCMSVHEEFESFLCANGINHITSAPYHPASNGLAERAVQIVKMG